MKFIINTNDSINETLKKCSKGDILHLNPGTYYEKVEVLVDDITITSNGDAIISNHDFYHKIMPDFNECNTFRTYTVYVGGNNVKIENITIENTSTPALKYGQAVALHVHGDNFYCENTIIRSEQDTLFTGPLPIDLIQRHQGFLKPYFLFDKQSRQIYKNCKIYGNVDFIFGCATALFDKCDIYTINRKKNEISYICAPSHAKETKFGYLFNECRLLTENNEGTIYLGRPWRDYGCAAFINCEMNEYINPLGFNKWNDTNRDKTARFYEYSENTDLSKREPWANLLTKNEAIAYIKEFYQYINKEEN